MPLTISNIADQNLLGAAASTGPLAFTIAYPENPSATFTVSASSSNVALVPNSNVVLGGSGASRTVTVTPLSSKKGTATITITATVSGTAVTASKTFLFTANRPSVYTDTYMDWTAITGPVDTYLYINFKPEVFNSETLTYGNFKEQHRPIELIYNGQARFQDLIESFTIVTQVGANGINRAPFNVETPVNPYNYGTSGPTMLKRRPWRVEIIPVTDPGLTVDIKYESRMAGVSNVPKRVGRYDITINATYVRNLPIVSYPDIQNGIYPTDLHNGTYRGFWSSYQDKPNTVPSQGSIFSEISFGNPFFDINEDVLTEEELNNLKFETVLYDFNTRRAPYKGYGDPSKYLVIHPRPIGATFTKTEFAYYGNTHVPEFITDPQILDVDDPNYPGNIPVRLTYAKANETSSDLFSALAPPIEVGTYTVTLEAVDLNYTGSVTQEIKVVPVSPSAAQEAATEYQEKIDIFEAEVVSTPKNSSLSSSSVISYSENVSTSDFIKSGVLSFLEKSDIPALGTVKTLAECAQNLPQKLMLFVAAKIAALVLSYIPGTGILKLLTSVMDLIKKVQQIMALIEFIKDNPWAFANMVLEATGAYAKLGAIANEQIDALKSQFPGITSGIGDVAGFVKDAANGLVDICNAVDINGNPLAKYIKADNTKVPEAIVAFIPATSRQPVEAKGKYDLFQFRLREALNKDTDKINTLTAEGDTVGVQEYVSMLTAVHELAYNYHDRIAATGSGSGLLSGSSTTSDGLDSVYNILSEATGILSSVYPQNSGTTNITTTDTSGSKKKAGLSVDTLNSGFNTAANIVSGITSGVGSVGSFLSGETGFSLTGLKNEFNYFAKETLLKNPAWSSETVNEYNKRVNKIKYEMENNSEAIRNNPANAGASAASSVNSASSSSSSGSSFLNRISSFAGSPLASTFLNK